MHSCGKYIVTQLREAKGSPTSPRLANDVSRRRCVGCLRRLHDATLAAYFGLEKRALLIGIAAAQFMNTGEYVAAVANMGSRWAAKRNVDLPAGSWPLIVAFGDPSNARTVRRISPGLVTRVTVEPFRTPISDTLRRRFPGLASPGSTLDLAIGVTFRPIFAETIRQGDFIKGPGHARDAPEAVI